jgi:hypothetical protein
VPPTSGEGEAEHETCERSDAKEHHCLKGTRRRHLREVFIEVTRLSTVRSYPPEGRAGVFERNPLAGALRRRSRVDAPNWPSSAIMSSP